MKKYIFKVDLDLKLNEKWLNDYIETRKVILKFLGLKIIKIIYRPSAFRGMHFWFHCLSKKIIKPIEANKIQFLLNDDQGRVLINSYRIKRNIPWSRGNKLYSKVIWVKKHKCNCEFHQKIIREMREGQRALIC